MDAYCFVVYACRHLRTGPPWLIIRSFQLFTAINNSLIDTSRYGAWRASSNEEGVLERLLFLGLEGSRWLSPQGAWHLGFHNPRGNQVQKQWDLLGK